jgi:hypothetical protein
MRVLLVMVLVVVYGIEEYRSPIVSQTFSPSPALCFGKVLRRTASRKGSREWKEKR